MQVNKDQGSQPNVSLITPIMLHTSSEDLKKSQEFVQVSTQQSMFEDLFLQFGENPFYTCLKRWAKQRKSEQFLMWLNSMGDLKLELSFHDIYVCVSKLCYHLKVNLKLQTGDRVMLCYPPGTDFVVTFLACLSAGIIAVPVYPPDPSKGQSDIQRFCDIKDIAGASLSLTNNQYRRVVDVLRTISNDSRFRDVNFIATDTSEINQIDIIDAIEDLTSTDESKRASYIGAKVRADSVAFLQFTSGSTSQPKGVVVTYGCLLFNVHLCIRSFCIPVFWDTSNKINSTVNCSLKTLQEDKQNVNVSSTDKNNRTEYSSCSISPGTSSQHKSDYDYDLDGVPIIFNDAPLSVDDWNFLKQNFKDGGLISLDQITYDKYYTYMSVINNIFKISTGHNIRAFSWLPLYHDMGLIGFVCAPIVFGCTVIHMSPLDFIRRPYIWLQAMDKYDCSCSGAPNFAFEVTIRKTSPEIMSKLNLSRILGILTGAEPVRYSTVTNFLNHFKNCGLKPSAIQPAYGLAEHTLIVSGNPLFRAQISSLTVKSQTLRENKLVDVVCKDGDAKYQQNADYITLVSSGHVFPSVDVRIVNPDTFTEVPCGGVGEIWISSVCVTSGYYQNYEVTAKAFNISFTQLDGSSSPASYLRTGDSGFIYKDMLFVVGRIKDLIIIRGRNYYPQDIEEAVDSVPGIRPGSSAAFAITQQNGEEFVGLAVEVRMETSLLSRVRRFFEKPAYDTIVRTISKAIFLRCGLPVHYIWLLAPRTVPKTSSGKVRRFMARDKIISKQITPLFEWICEQTSSLPTYVERSSQFISPTSVIISRSSNSNPYNQQSETCEGQVTVPKRDNRSGTYFTTSETPEDIKEKIIYCASEVLNIPASSLDLNAPLHEYGIDSMGCVRFSELISEELGLEIEPTILFNYPTAHEIIEFIIAELTGKCQPQDIILRRDNNLKHTKNEIAIIGASCNFPGGSTTPELFWEMLQSCTDAIVEIPRSRWDIDEFYSADIDAENKMYVREGGFIEDADMFGASFFRISPAEARAMDPQQRIFLDTAYEALSRSGYSRENLSKQPISVFVGCCSNDWNQICKSEEITQSVGTYAATSHAASIIANRVSYTLGLTGSSVTVDSACSASLVALHVSIHELTSSLCEAAVVGGINLMLSPQITIALCKARMLSVDCRCKVFDASANGYARGEGVGVLILKSLQKAIKNGNTIISVVKGTAVNHSGRAASLTAPNGISQQKVIRAALIEAQVVPSSIQYIEAHGTGTSLGDPIEMSALKAVFSHGRDSGKPLIVGAVKTNVGHLEGAAGMAGLFKAMLAIKHQIVPPNIHFKSLNPHIDLKGFPVVIPVIHTPINSYDNCKRLAGISSFGFGGTNSHVIIEEPPTIQETSESADDIEIFETPTTAFIFGFQGFQFVNMARSLFETEAVYKESFLTCCQILDPLLNQSLLSIIYPQGTDPVHLSVAQCKLDQLIFCHCTLFAVQYSMAKLWVSKGVTPEVVIGFGDGELVAATFAGSLSLEDGLKICLLRASIISAFSSENEGTLVLCNSSEEDMEMIIADVSSGDNSSVVVAANLGLNEILLSGKTSEIESILVALKSTSAESELMHTSSRMLGVSHALHTPVLKDAVEPIAQLLSGNILLKPELPFISGKTGNFVLKEITNPRYWAWQIVDKIKAYDAIKTAISAGCRVFIDVGPTSVTSPIDIELMQNLNKESENFETIRNITGNVLRTMTEDDMLIGQSRLSSTVLLDSEVPNNTTWISSFTSEGYSLPKFNDLTNYVQQVIKITKITPRTYLEKKLPKSDGLFPREAFPWVGIPHPFLKNDNKASAGYEFKSLSYLSSASVRLLSDHIVYGHIVMPAAGFVEIAAAALSTSLGLTEERCTVTLKSAIFESPMIIGNDKSDIEYSTVLENIPNVLNRNSLNFENSDKTGKQGNVQVECIISGSQELVISSSNTDDEVFTQNFSCLIENGGNLPKKPISLEDLRVAYPIEFDVNNIYRELSRVGLKYGNRFRTLKELYKSEDAQRALGKLSLSKFSKLDSFEKGFFIHPTIIDGSLHVASILVGNLNERNYELDIPGSSIQNDNKNEEKQQPSKAMIPVSIDRATLIKSTDCDTFWANVSICNQDRKTATINVELYDSKGYLVVELSKVVLCQLDSTSMSFFSFEGQTNDLLWTNEWITYEQLQIQNCTEVASNEEIDNKAKRFEFIKDGLQNTCSILVLHFGEHIPQVLNEIQDQFTNFQYLNLKKIKSNSWTEELVKCFSQNYDCVVFLPAVEIEDNSTGELGNEDAIHVLNAGLSICKAIIQIYTMKSNESQIIQDSSKCEQSQISPKYKHFKELQNFQPSIPVIWILTYKTQNLQNTEVIKKELPIHAGLWAMARSARIEMKMIYSILSPIRCLDVEFLLNTKAEYKRNQAEILSTFNWINSMSNISRLDTEYEFCIRSRAICVSRLKKCLDVAIKGPLELCMIGRGSLTNLKLRDMSSSQRASPRKGEVEIRVRSIGLNFRDVLNVMGLYPGDPGPP
ncbi:hypothetical protein ACR3K2_27670, partial [Cryptosporidium serpentis]